MTVIGVHGGEIPRLAQHFSHGDSLVHDIQCQKLAVARQVGFPQSSNQAFLFPGLAAIRRAQGNHIFLAFKTQDQARAEFLSRALPGMVEALAAGDLHLSAIKLLDQHLTPKNCAELIAAADLSPERAITALEANQQDLSLDDPLYPDSDVTMHSLVSADVGEACDGATPCRHPAVCGGPCGRAFAGCSAGAGGRFGGGNRP